MHLKLFTPKQSLNKAYLKEKISRSAIEFFKLHFNALTEKINDKGDEEHLKSLIADFLKLTYYNQSQHQVGPIGKNDLVIHAGKSPADPYGVILEVKSPANKAEMISGEKANVKATHELVLYYLDERVARNRNELKQLIVTNIYDWYIIDANEFDNKVYRNTAIKKLYELKKTDNKDNPWFYDELKKLLAASTDFSIDATFFDLRDYKKITGNANKQDDKGLIALYKILSPVNLLKLPFANDSNTLQPKFYSELLHLVGLYEYKDGSKKLISRKKDGERNRGSLLENAIEQLDSHDKISRLDKPSQYGDNYGDRIYAVALELVITWVNRILFLKLLEAQLINYHKGDRDYTFLDKEKIKDFGDLDKLFFRVLAKRVNERNDDVQKLFSKVPYLNSSLFEPTELEHQTLFIHGLEDFVPLPVISSTVLKDTHGKTLKGNLNTLDYLFAFLNAYDFSSEGAEEIQEDNKQLINASVLGLIFEKINGYKDGSFFTPGFITMYMCRETIRRAVVQKFNETKGWDCQEYSELYDRITDKKEANTLINSLKICDPAVGSGHFLVSALNEIIAIKSDLRVLTGRDGRGMHHYGIELVNDELIITDEDGDIFEYNPNSKESQRVQETLFHEKQTIIENCLFGVDINPNSVKICRLRLWIELLKNAYYKADTRELETLPNIDINIKTGNSLISRFALDADLKQALRGSKWNINDYRIAVATYKNATDKNAKRELVGLIDTIKQNFSSSISRNGKEYKELSKLRGQLDKLLSSNEDLFGVKKNKNELELEQRRLEISIENQETAIEEIRSSKIYANAFEWRFEFPEVLSDDGDFIGFDVVIGNPPYKLIQPSNTTTNELKYFKSNFKFAEFKIDLFHLFFQQGSLLVKNDGLVILITPSSILNNVYTENLRNLLGKTHEILTLAVTEEKIFDDADVHTGIFQFRKVKNANQTNYINLTTDLINVISNEVPYRKIKQSDFTELQSSTWNLMIDETNVSLFNKISNNQILKTIAVINRGLITGDRDKYFSKEKKSSQQVEILSGTDIKRYYHDSPSEYVLFERPASAGGCWDKDVHFAPYKICIRQIGNAPTATLIQEPYAVTGNIFTITHTDLSLLKSILGLINSRVINYYWKYMFSDFKTTFPQITIFSLNTIPVPNLSNIAWRKINSMVDEILRLKKIDHNFDTAFFENKIDQLVYQLYGLTEDEIKIVEGAV